MKLSLPLTNPCSVLSVVTGLAALGGEAVALQRLDSTLVRTLWLTKAMRSMKLVSATSRFFFFVD